MSSRTYRFAPLDHKAWLLGLTGTQCLVLGTGLTVSATLLRLPIPLLLAVSPLLVAVAAAFAPLAGMKAYEVAGVGFTFLRGRPSKPWLAPIPLFTSPTDQPKLLPPPTLAGVELREVPRPDWAGQAVRGIAVITGKARHDATVVIRARASGFALSSRADQDRSLARWGDVLSSFCSESSTVSRIVVSEHAGPADLTASRRWIAANAAAASEQVRRDYDALLDDIGQRAAAHDALITLTIDRRRAKGDLDATLLSEARRLIERLDAAGIVGTVLTPQELAATVATRMDPSRPAKRSTSLVDAVGLAPVVTWPLSHRTRWTDVRTDGAVHRAWWIAEWPRLDVGAAWLDPLLSTRAARRTVVLVFEPVAPSVSRRRIERDATRLATDAEQRANRGFRIGARHSRSRDAVEEREAELVAGYAEVGVVGLVIATAVTDDELDAAATQIGQAANAAGLELRQLDGRHDLALAASLPLGRPVQEPRL
jgi:hypothetical protein